MLQLYIADTPIQRFMGYMLRKQPHYEGILLKPCNSIHTFFMKFDLDVLFVNEHYQIIKKIDGLKPGKIVMPVKGAVCVIEAKAGQLKKCSEGDFISLMDT